MNKKYISAFILSFGIIFSAILVSATFAQTGENSAENPASIQFPIQELGNCQDKESCKEFCDKPENSKTCLDFAQKNNLMSQEEVAKAKKFSSSGLKGPGGCNSKDSCEKYCNDISRIDECVTFAEKNDIMPQKELEEAKKVRQAIKNGIKPPACNNKKECDVYCSAPDHMEECMIFAQSAGLMDEKEKQESQKFLQAIKRGVKPPKCRGKEECDLYCNAPENIEECITFAQEAGMMDENEKQETQKFLQAIKKGVKPPKCRGKEECDLYCAEESHFEECMNFAEAAGFMTAEEAQMSRKTKGKGPGGCRGKEECEAFCANNQEACFQFAKDNGLIKPEEMQRMEEGKIGMQRALNEAPAQVIECLNSALGADMIAKLKSGEGMPSQKIGDTMKSCFEKIGGPQRDGEFTGPGGCKSPDECKTYCQSNPGECEGDQGVKMDFPDSNRQMPQNSGPNPMQNFPPEVFECLKSSAGENIAEQIKTGTLQPGPEIGEKIKNCFGQSNRENLQNMRPQLQEGKNPIDTFKPIIDGINPQPPKEMMELSPEKRQLFEDQYRLQMQNQQNIMPQELQYPQVAPQFQPQDQMIPREFQKPFPDSNVPQEPLYPQVAPQIQQEQPQQPAPVITPQPTDTQPAPDIQPTPAPETQESQQSSSKNTFTAKIINFFTGIFSDR